MSAIGFSDTAFPRAHRRPALSAFAEYRHSDLFFQRTQSLAMRDATWERRAKPLRSWGALIAPGAVVAAGALLSLAMI